MTVKLNFFEVMVPVAVIGFTVGLVSAFAEQDLGLSKFWSILLGALVAVLVLIALNRLAAGFERRMFIRAGRCPNCGHNMGGKLDDGCPECGWGRTGEGEVKE